MKNLCAKNNLVKVALAFLMLFMVFGSLMSSVATVYAGGDDDFQNTEDQGGGGNTGSELKDLSEKATTTLDTVREYVVKIGNAAGLLSLAIIIFLLVITHDERKIAGYLKTGGIILAALVLLNILNADIVLDLVQAIANDIAGK